MLVRRFALRLGVLAVVFSFVASAQEVFVRLVVPESDTVRTTSGTYRLSASTNPRNTLSINGKPLKVYPSGAVAGVLEIRVGDNLFTLSATSPAGTLLNRSFLIIRDPPMETSPASPLQIDTVMMRPVVDVWLDEGDLLEVQMKGSPECKASFLHGIPMTEVPAQDAGGIRGIYRGVYRVKRTDTLNASPIVFHLESIRGDTIQEAMSKGKVSFKADEFPLIGVTKGERPSLGFGLGEDRLGGAKMSFLVPGVRLAVSGKNGGQYRVALAPGREAWIAEEMVDLLPHGAHRPLALTGNWNVYGDEKFDYVTLSVGGKLPYASYQESNPARINVDVFGATSNSNWIIQSLSTREITNVSYTQPSTGVFRITIELKHKQIWGYEIGYTPAGLSIKVRRQPEKLKIKRLTFAVDAGHGGGNLGALGSTGAMEKDVTLAVVRCLKAELENRGAQVVLTRENDVNYTMGDRLKKVLATPADILISIHANSIGLTTNPEDTRGTSTYYKHICYRPLSLCIVKELLKSGLQMYGNVGSFNFTLNSPTELPNVLVETAFLSNPEDEMKLLDDKFQHELAERIADGVEEFLDWADD